jgi:DNA-3-methyladenine glycosylase
MHVCANLVAEPEGRAGGILLRAVEPLLGIDAMQRRRGLERAKIDRRLAGGPGRLGQAFGFDLAHDGASALAGEWTVRAPAGGAEPATRVERTARIGLSQGGELPYRFVEVGSPWLSRAVPGRGERRRRR